MMTNKVKSFAVVLLLLAASLQGYAQKLSLPASKHKKPVELYSLKVSSCPNSEISIPVKANHFSERQSRFSLHWDPAVVSFVAVERFGLRGLGQPAFDTREVSKGKLHFDWQDAAGEEQKLPDGSIVFALRFKLIGASSRSTNLTLGGESFAIGKISIGTQKEAVAGFAGDFTVKAGYPNPFTKETKISYTIPQDGMVNLTISDVNGRVVKTLRSSGTDRAIVWDGRGAAGAGVYFCTLEYAGIRKTIKLLKAE